MERIEDFRREGDLVTWRATDPSCGPEETILTVNSGIDEYVPVPVWSRKNTFAQRVARTGGTICRKVTNFMTPPLWASVASIMVALYQPLQHIISSHLRPLRGAITQAGDCSIPLTLVVLGAYFHRAPEKAKLPAPDDLESQRATPLSQLRKIFCLESENRMGPIRLEADTSRLGNSGEGRMVFAIILARMFIVPLLLLPLVVLGARQGSPGVFKEYVLAVEYHRFLFNLSCGRTSPVFILSQVLLLASPPALTLAQVRSSFHCQRQVFQTLSTPFFLHLADLGSHQRLVRTMDKPHSILVVLSRHPSRYYGVCIDRHVDHKALNRVDSLATTLMCRVTSTGHLTKAAHARPAFVQPRWFWIFECQISVIPVGLYNLFSTF